VGTVRLGVRDLPRARQFYGEGLGWPIEQDYPVWVSFTMGYGSSTLGLYPWEQQAGDAGVEADGTGFRGVTLSYIVRSDDRVAALLAEADGYLWKVASGTGDQPFAE
jgi:catechol 2,3-dioxygenase-like lactoylglutathione lyase family enzyme